MTAVESPLVGVIRWAGNAQQLWQQHTARPDGRCPLCRPAGTSSGHVKSPCNVWCAADVVLRNPGGAGKSGAG